MNAEQGEFGPQRLNTLPTPTTQTSSPENNNQSSPIESHSDAALRQLKTLIENGADSDTIERAKAVVAETIAMEQQNNANTARAAIADIHGAPAEQPASHLNEATPTKYVKPFPVVIRSQGVNQAPKPLDLSPPKPPRY